MKITERDKKLLYVIAGLLLIFCAYFFGYRTLSSKADEYSKEADELKTTYNNLQLMKVNAGKYSKDTISFTDGFTELIAKYDSGYSQENSIMFLNELEEKFEDVWISQAGLAQTAQLYAFGQNTSTNPSKTGQSVYTTDYLGYSTTLTLTYAATYEEYKELIDYINTYKYKCTIDSMSASYNAETDTVSGTMVVTQYAIVGADRPYSEPYISDPMNGTFNIFNSAVFTPGTDADVENGNSIIGDYDYYMTLQSSKSDDDAIIIGQKDDPTGDSVLSNNGNAMQKVAITFSGEEGDYKVQYQIGNVTYPATAYDAGASFVPGNMLSLLVISSERNGTDDLSGANVTLVNNTDMTLRVKVVNEDENSPRFILDQKSGDIVIYE